VINDALRTATGTLRPTLADKLPVLAGIQLAELRGKGACTVSSTPCHRACTPAPPSSHRFTRWERTATQIETPICTRHTTHSPSDSNNIRAAQWADHQLDNTTRLRTFIPDISIHPPGKALPRTAWVRLNRLRTGVGRFRSCLCKWDMSSSAACEFGAEERTVGHVIIQCPNHRSPHGLHGLTVLDDETIEWLLNTCPEIYCGLAGYELAQTMKKTVQLTAH